MESFKGALSDLLLNLSLFLVHLFLYDLLVFTKKIPRNRKLKILDFFLVSLLVLCMFFPVKIGVHMTLDLRNIVYLIMIIYGGIAKGIILLVLSIPLQYLINQQGLTNTIFTVSIITPLTYYLYLKFMSNRKQVTKFVTIQAIFVGIIKLLFSFIENREIFFHSYFWFICVVIVIYKLLATYVLLKIIYNIHERQKLRNQVFKSERIKTVGELAAAVAHEIRNPLTSSKGFIALTLEEELDEKSRKYLSIVASEIDSTLNTVDNFVKYAYPNFDVKKPVEISKLVMEVLDLIKGYALHKNIEFSYNQGDNSQVVEADRERLKECIIAILMNAVESMPHGGNIVIKTRSKDKYIHIEVQDQGIGMTKDQMENIGLPNYSLEQKGVGLTMAFCFQYINAIGGTIEYASTKGKGTLVNIRMPRINT